MITYEQMRQACEELAAEKGPGFRYRPLTKDGWDHPADGWGCLYRPMTEEDWPGMPADAARRTTGCLIGEAIKRLDPEAYEQIKDECECIEDFNSQLDEPFLSHEAERFAQEAQVHQDRGETWAEAVKAGTDLIEGERAQRAGGED